MFESCITDLARMILMFFFGQGDLRGRFESLSVSGPCTSLNQVALCDLLSIISKGNGSEARGSVSTAASLLGVSTNVQVLHILPSIAETLSQYGVVRPSEFH